MNCTCWLVVSDRRARLGLWCRRRNAWCVETCACWFSPIRRSVVSAVSDRGEIQIKNPSADSSEMPKVFTYDQTYGPDATQRGIFDMTAAPIVGMRKR
jgi:hypothetical protein